MYAKERDKPSHAGNTSDIHRGPPQGGGSTDKKPQAIIYGFKKIYPKLSRWRRRKLRREGMHACPPYKVKIMADGA